MADGWISGLLRRFFLVCTNFSPGEQGGGWVGERGEVGGGSDYHTAPFRVGEATESSPYHTTRPRRHLANDGNSFRSWPAQLVPSIDAILLTVTSQGQQNVLQESKPAHTGQHR